MHFNMLQLFGCLLHCAALCKFQGVIKIIALVAVNAILK